jgi:hypothetical protein
VLLTGRGPHGVAGTHPDHCAVTADDEADALGDVQGGDWSAAVAVSELDGRAGVLIQASEQVGCVVVEAS